MKIAIFHCAFIYTGGGERIVLGQYDQLTSAGHIVEIWTPVLDREKCYPDIIGQYPIKTFLPQLPSWLPFRHAFTLVLTCLLAPLFAKKFSRVDVIIGENQPGVWLAYCVSKILRKPYLVYLCHPNKMVYPRPLLDRRQLWQAVKDFYLLSWFVSWSRPLVGYLDKISVRGGRKVLVNGYYIGHEIEKVYGVAWEGCPCGVSFNHLSAKDMLMEDSIDNRLIGAVSLNGLFIKKPFLLFTGRHEVWKRIDLAIRAFSLVSECYPNLHLVIPGPFTRCTLQLQELVRKLDLVDRVLFLGSIEQSSLAKLYREAAVYVFPSTLEDFGISVLEAMAFGAPVVAWRIGGPLDTIIDGQTGYLAQPYHLEEFADKIASLISDRDKLSLFSQRAYQHVAENFSWSNHMVVLEKALREISL